MHLGVLGLLLLAICGCATPTTTVTESKSLESSIDTLCMTCKDPYPLTQDCSIWSGATRKLSINGFDVRVAGSEKGDIVLVMDAHYVRNVVFGNPFDLGFPRYNQAVNKSFEAVKEVLVDEKLELLEVIPVASITLDGYVIKLNGDGYSILKKYTKN